MVGDTELNAALLDRIEGVVREQLEGTNVTLPTDDESAKYLARWMFIRITKALGMFTEEDQQNFAFQLFNDPYVMALSAELCGYYSGQLDEAVSEAMDAFWPIYALHEELLRNGFDLREPIIYERHNKQSGNLEVVKVDPKTHEISLTVFGRSGKHSTDMDLDRFEEFIQSLIQPQEA